MNHLTLLALILIRTVQAWVAVSPLRTRLFPRTRVHDYTNPTETEVPTTETSEKSSVLIVEEKKDGMPSSSLVNGNPEARTLNQPIQKSLREVMEEITKPRPYPLFLAEKAAELFERSFPTGFRRINGHNKELNKERVVVLGTGWGAMSFLKTIDSDLYDVTVISPRNHFIFTPMLAGACVGTVEFRSITEPIREINRQANYLEATATKVDPRAKAVKCEAVVCDDNQSCETREFEVLYDRLVFTIGAQTNTFGIPGVKEHCKFLKSIDDARSIRASVVDCFERANLPGLSDQQRHEALTFAVIGAGPSGIEFAAELRDFVEQDGPRYYPHLLKYVGIKVIEATSRVLAPFDRTLQDEAIRRLQRKAEFRDHKVRDSLPDNFALLTIMLDSAVKEISEKTIDLKDGTTIPFGLAVWAAGNGPLPLTKQLVESLGAEQGTEQAVARGRLAIDPWMRVIGAEGSILALGDCAIVSRGQQLLPATGQVAAQQGEYLANLMNRRFVLSPARSEDGAVPPPTKDPMKTVSSLSDAIASYAVGNSEYAKPFQFLNLGILAYTSGCTALAEVSRGPNRTSIKGTGKLGNAVWRSVYLSKQVSWRNRAYVFNDWVKRRVFGRDITRL